MRAKEKREKRDGAAHPPIVVTFRGADACARALAKVAVENALKKLGLDNGPTIGNNDRQPTEKGPVSATNTDEAKERVQ